MRFSEAALDVLIAHSWPGNIRELRNTVVKAALLSQAETIVPEDLPLVMHPPGFGGSNGHNGMADDGASSFETRAGNGTYSATRGEARPETRSGASLEGMERRMIMEALYATGGHQQRAAARLGISRRTLSRKLKLYEAENAGAVV
jgi:DNA-binding NtrC family response regulator